MAQNYETYVPLAPTECTTTEAFSNHGLADGVALLRRTVLRLRIQEMSFEPTPVFFDALEEAFLGAYVDLSDDGYLPDRVAAAANDARALTAEEFRHQKTADLRTDVIPTFYQHAAGFHCQYRA